MNKHLNTEKLKKHSLLYRLTAVIFMIITLDSAYIYLTVRKMAENTITALEQYHAVPLMTEHILAAVIIYLGLAVLIHRITE